MSAAFFQKTVNDLLTCPRGMECTDLLALAYSAAPEELDWLITSAGIAEAYGTDRARWDELPAHVVLGLQNNRWVDNGRELGWLVPWLGKEGRILGIPRQGGASFHPKLTALRYKGAMGEARRLRLIVSSRNLTPGAALEGAVCLETEDFSAPDNDPRLAALLKLLEPMKNKLPSSLRKDLAHADFSDCVRGLAGAKATYRFLTPEGEGGLYQAVSELAAQAEKLVIVSPFLGEAAFLRSLLEKSPAWQGGQPLVITNREIAPALWADAALKSRICCLERPVPSEGGEPAYLPVHAKVFAFTLRDSHHLILGSANCSGNGLCRNRELDLHIADAAPDFVDRIWETLLQMGKKAPCIPWTETAAPERTDTPNLPVWERTDGEATETLAERCFTRRASDALMCFFLEVFQAAPGAQAPVDYAISQLSSASPQDPQLWSQWQTRLKGFDREKLPAELRHYYDALAEILRVKGGNGA